MSDDQIPPPLTTVSDPTTSRPRTSPAKPSTALTHAIVCTSLSTVHGRQRVVQPINADQAAMPEPELMDLYWMTMKRRFPHRPIPGTITWEVISLEGKRVMRDGQIVEQPELMSVPPISPATLPVEPLPNLAEIAAQSDMTPDRIQAIMDEQLPFPQSPPPAKPALKEWVPPWI